MRTDELDFHLPTELIAQEPAAQREESRLLHYRRSDRAITHTRFSQLPDLLRAGDLLVFNDTRVIPARFMLRKETGGLIDGLFLSQPAPNRWCVLLKNVGNYAGPMHFVQAPDLFVRARRAVADGEYELDLTTDELAITILNRVGRMPLPPYIKRDKGHDERDDFDGERYQTVYASSPGSVAAPTAGLHFTPELLRALDERGIERVNITLDVGMGTFKPVTAERIEDHVMHAENYQIGAGAAEALNRAKSQDRRIVAVGTTSARVLESQSADAPFTAKTDRTQLLIYPPYEWKHVSGLITNFHLPRSTLIALVGALISLEEQRRIYEAAIRERYRFFSYGDAMLIE